MLTPTGLIATGLPIDIRPPDPQQDSIDGVVPGVIVEPRSAEGVAATLAWASEQRLSVVIRGAGTKTGWGRPPARVDVLLSMRGLNRILSHRQGDLTVTVEAGTSLLELNRALSAHGQWLPLDPSFDERATVGGLLASNDSGPSRHRFGTPRDLVIGVRMATTGGQLAKSGGQVVKNVAGYDLSKLISGSFGQLAAVVSATFKLSPLPGASTTVVVEPVDAAALRGVLDAILASQLEPVAFEIDVDHSGGASEAIRCLLRFAAMPDAVRAASAEARARLAAIHTAPDELTGEREDRTWRQHRRGLWDRPGAVLRASWLPDDLPAVSDLLRGVGAELMGRVAVGAGLIRLEGDVVRQARAIAHLRASTTVGHVVLLRGDAELKQAVDVWGPVPNQALLGSIKRELDPNGILGANRGPL
jgi:glycolate oxidase FAD binding subunit